MSIFAAMDVAGAEQVVFNQDAGSGLRSIIVVHDTTLGPALGGVRVWPYDSEIAALADGLRLAEAMTLKAAAAGVELGGGASLVIGNSGTDKTDEAMRAHGRFIASLGGRFIPVNDVGTTQDDIRTIGEEASPSVPPVTHPPTPRWESWSRSAPVFAMRTGRAAWTG